MSEDLLRDDNALGWLRAEHSRIEELLASCLESDQVEFTRQALIPLFQELEAHAEAERQVFFPYIASMVDPVKIDRPAANLDEMDRLADRLRSLDPADDNYFATLNELIDVFHRHAYTEEEFLFVPVEMSTPDVHNDLIRKGVEMNDLRIDMLKRARPVRRDVVASKQAREERREAMLEPTERERPVVTRREDRLLAADRDQAFMNDAGIESDLPVERDIVEPGVGPTRGINAGAPIEQRPSMSNLAGVGNDIVSRDRVNNELEDNELSDNELDDTDLPLHQAATDDWEQVPGEIDIVTWDVSGPTDEPQPGI